MESSGSSGEPTDEAFERVYRAAWSPVFRYSLALVRDLDDAADIAAETFGRAYVAWRAGKGPSAEPLPWLFLIARRIFIDHERRHRLVRWLRLPSAAGTPSDDPLYRSELWLWFGQLCDVLPTRQREAVVLRYGFDQSDAVIGHLMGISPGGVRTLVSRALSQMRSDLEVPK